MAEPAAISPAAGFIFFGLPTIELTCASKLRLLTENGSRARPNGAAGMTERRTRRAKRPMAYALLATLSVGLLAASALGLALRGWAP